MKTKTINYTKLIIAMTIVNIIAWILLEFWHHRYGESDIAFSAGWLTLLQIIGYYIAIIKSQIPSSEIKIEPEKYGPHNCPGHDWQIHKYNEKAEQCIICEAERGKKQ